MKPAQFSRSTRRGAMVLTVALVLASRALCPELLAGEDKTAPAPLEPAATASTFKLSGEFDLSQSYVGSASVLRNGRGISLDEYNSEASFVLNPRIPLGFLRVGAGWSRYSFGFAGNGTPLPNTLQSVRLLLGLDTHFYDSILVRIEAQPGLYGASFNHLGLGQARVPLVIGGTYIYSPELQIIAGISVDADRQYPILPGAGVRWKFAPDWVFNGVFPTPRLEYSLTRDSTLYVGAEFKEETFRTDSRDGASKLDRRLNRALVTFSEVRAGVGFEKVFSSSLNLTVEGGCQPSREFNFQRSDIRYRADGIAPYGQIMFHGAF